MTESDRPLYPTEAWEFQNGPGMDSVNRYMRCNRTRTPKEPKEEIRPFYKMIGTFPNPEQAAKRSKDHIILCGYRGEDGY